MNRNGPIIIIEDDKEDQELMKEALSEISISNEILIFGDSEEALHFLLTTPVEPFIIFSDVNMPKISGLELRQKLQTYNDLRIQSVPYLFLTTSAENRAVIEAYKNSIQGFFIKPSTFSGIRKLLQTVVAYWQNCVQPY
jgi:response regulator RpfG family c-di-GMP phosphodiesterase